MNKFGDLQIIVRDGGDKRESQTSKLSIVCLIKLQYLIFLQKFSL